MVPSRPNILHVEDGSSVSRRSKVSSPPAGIAGRDAKTNVAWAWMGKQRNDGDLWRDVTSDSAPDISKQMSLYLVARAVPFLLFHISTISLTTLPLPMFPNLPLPRPQHPPRPPSWPPAALPRPLLTQPVTPNLPLTPFPPQRGNKPGARSVGEKPSQSRKLSTASFPIEDTAISLS
jgi:hypothetical protein